MTGRRPLSPEAEFEAFAHETNQERASALGRAGRALEAAILAYEAASETDKRARLADVANAFWILTVQREALGLRGTRDLMRTYRVPSAALALAGVVERTRP